MTFLEKRGQKRILEQKKFKTLGELQVLQKQLILISQFEFQQTQAENKETKGALS